MKTPPLKMKITTEEFHSMVVDRRMSDTAIGRELGVCGVTVASWRGFYGVSQPSLVRKVYESAAPPENFFVSEADLLRMYCDENLSQQKIANVLKVSQVTVSQWLRKYGIATRNKGGQVSVFIEDSILRDMYLDRGMTMAAIAKDLHKSESSVRVNILRCGLNISMDDVNRRRRTANKEIFAMESMGNGYRVIRQPGHPRSTATGYVGEHILTVEFAMQREVRDGEQVHHINLNKLDNAETNLAVLPSKADHAAVHKYMERAAAFMLFGGIRPEAVSFGREVFWGGRYVTSIDLIGDRAPLAQFDHGAVPNFKEETISIQ